MKRVLSLLLVFAVSSEILCAATPNPRPNTRPNFVLIIGDDISAADLGCFGNPGIRTPNLDRLAAESRVFDNAYVTASSCSPSRCSIITSRYPHNLETAAELHRVLPAGLALFPKVLREAGYFTAQAGKAHFGEGGPLNGPAKEAFEASSGADKNELEAGNGGENQWINHLRSRPADRPFFMWFGSADAHRSWNADSFSGINRPADVRVPSHLADTPETRQDLAHYYDEITRLDYHVGEVVRELKRQRVHEQTVIIFLSDNGRPFPHAKTHVYDDGMKTPLIIRIPATMARPGRTAALASSIDIGPTVLELARLPKPETFQGVSLVPILRDPGATVRDYVFAEQNWHNFPAHVRMVRSGTHVYIRNAWPDLRLPGASDTFYNPSADALKALHAQGRLTPAQSNIFMQPRASEEFYDLSTDPDQVVNLVSRDGSHEAILRRLRSVLTRWQQETGDSVPKNPTPADVDYASGKKKTEFWRGTPPGADANAAKINRPGPIREG